MIEIRDISKSFGSDQAKVEALKEVSFSVEKGEYTVIFGPSGSGKTTLLTIMAGLHKPTRGEIVIDDISIYDAFAQSPYAAILDYIEPAGDVFHNNTVVVLDGSQEHRSAIFRKGNLLICMRMLNTIAIIDPRKKQVVWALKGLWRQQHRAAKAIPWNGWSAPLCQ